MPKPIARSQPLNYTSVRSQAGREYFSEFLALRFSNICHTNYRSCFIGQSESTTQCMNLLHKTRSWKEVIVMAWDLSHSRNGRRQESFIKLHWSHNHVHIHTRQLIPPPPLQCGTTQMKTTCTIHSPIFWRRLRRQLQEVEASRSWHNTVAKLIIQRDKTVLTVPSIDNFNINALDCWLSGVFTCKK